MIMPLFRRRLLVAATLVACASDVADSPALSGGATDGQDTNPNASATSTLSSGATQSGPGSSGTGGGLKLDVGSQDSDTVGSACQVDPDDGAAPGPCVDQAPAGSFEPVLQWEFAGVGERRHSATAPLVANLTDDNGDGNIDLCDTPDIVALLWPPGDWDNGQEAQIFVLDGATGEVHFSIPELVSDMNPALGDIDGDGLPEIVAQAAGGGPIAFEHDGTVKKWPAQSGVHPRFNAISLADLDNDGDVEVVFPGAAVFDHNGVLVVPPSPGGFWEGSTPIAVDLDGDDDMEILDGLRAIHHDGTPYWNEQDITGCPDSSDGAALQAAVADFDADGQPEVFYAGRGAQLFCILTADGTLVANASTLPGFEDADAWERPPAVHDVDGDGVPDVALGASSNGDTLGYFGVLRVLEGSITSMFVKTDIDESGNAGATAFDFLGDGTAEAIYADHVNLFAYDATGTVQLQVSRESYTQIEYPVVADVDNDGSAEFVVVSNLGDEAPVRVFGDAQDRWIPARRIWNQHTYHVTNVREDGTIPMVEPKHWLGLNTFRTQAQITPGQGTCEPAG